MSTVADLMGLGMPAALANRLGNTPVTVTTTGTSQATAAAITTHLTILTTASSQQGAIFSTSASLGAPFYVTCPTATTGVVYCPVSGTMNGTTNGGLSIAQNKTAVFIQTSNLVWVSILTA